MRKTKQSQNIVGLKEGVYNEGAADEPSNLYCGSKCLKEINVGKQKYPVRYQEETGVWGDSMGAQIWEISHQGTYGTVV